MKYYVMADIHGYYTEMITALKEAGYFEDQEPHKIIICGDLFDRGSEALKLQEFILEKMNNDEIILIKGNHEDLVMDMLNKWHVKSYMKDHHISNGTVDTVMQLIKAEKYDDIYYHSEESYNAFKETPYITKIIPSMINYFETPNYIFVHGWLPCTVSQYDYFTKQYSYIKDWRSATEDEWNRSRWLNGMEAAHKGIIEEGKITVCGHWNCSFGHEYYEGKYGDYSPFVAKGIMAIDAHTIKSHKVNCLVIED